MHAVLAVPILASFTGRKIPLATWGAGAVALFGEPSDYPLHWRAALLPACLTSSACAGVSLLTSGGTGFNKGDALCILSAFIFGLHKFRTESITQRFDDTQDLVAVQLAILAFCSFLNTVPTLWHLLPNSTPGLSAVDAGLYSCQLPAAAGPELTAGAVLQRSSGRCR